MEREIHSYMHSTAGLDACVGHDYLCYDLGMNEPTRGLEVHRDLF